jgi:hypothetical protein
MRSDIGRYLDDQLKPIDTERWYLESLNEETVEVCGMTYLAGDVLKEIDPTAFRCGHNDWCDSEMTGLNDVCDTGNGYYQVNEAIDLWWDRIESFRDELTLLLQEQIDTLLRVNDESMAEEGEGLDVRFGPRSDGFVLRYGSVDYDQDAYGTCCGWIGHGTVVSELADSLIEEAKEWVGTEINGG